MALVCGCALSLYGFYQYKIGVAPLATWEDPTVEGSGTRIFATLGNPNLLAGMLVPLTSIGVGLALGFFAQFKSAGNSKFLIPAIAALGAGGMITVATILTGSRGPYLGIAAGLGILIYVATLYVWVEHKKWRTAVLAAALCLLRCSRGGNVYPSLEPTGAINVRWKRA